MATVIFQAPVGKSIGIYATATSPLWRIRPNELFGLNTADSAQTDAFLAAGFDYSEHSAYGGVATVLTDDLNKWHAHNPYELVADP